MTTKAIAFIGTNDYKRTTYYFGDEEHETLFLSVAIATIFKPDKVYVLVTKEAKEKHGEALTKEFSLINTQLDLVHIPSATPSSEKPIEAQLWEIFSAITECIHDGDTVVFDITNAFRPIPFLSFLAAAYVKAARKNVTIKYILYGAYENNQTRTPILDFTEFLKLLDWINATTSFQQTGRANFTPLLADNQFKGLSEALKALSTNLYTSRTAAILEGATSLKDRIAKAQTMANDSASKPFTMLLEQLDEDVGKLALADPTNPRNSREALEKMLNLIEWYIEKEMINQALTYAREWLVSLVLYRNGQAFFVNHEQRNRAARAITEEPSQRQQQRQPEVHFEPERIRDIREVWRYLEAGKIRNDVAHCGMNLGALPANEIVNGANQIAQKLRALLPEE